MSWHNEGSGISSGLGSGLFIVNCGKELGHALAGHVLQELGHKRVMIKKKKDYLKGLAPTKEDIARF